MFLQNLKQISKTAEMGRARICKNKIDAGMGNEVNLLLKSNL